MQIIADDLGYNDLGFTDGEKTRERTARFFYLTLCAAAQLLAPLLFC